MAQAICRLPEYEAAVAELTWHLTRQMMTASHPVLEMIEHREVGEISTGHVDSDVAIGFSREVETPIRFAMDIPALINTDLGAWATMIFESAQSGVQQLMREFYAGLDAACQRAGTLLDGADRPFWDVFMDGIERMPIDFDTDGKPKMPTLIMHPDTIGALQKTSPNEDQKRRYLSLIEKKRVEFAARASELEERKANRHARRRTRRLA